MISPLLANIFLHAFDAEMTQRGVGVLVRYDDDFVVLCRSAEQAQAALDQARDILAGLGLDLHPDKTKVVDLRVDQYVVSRLRGLMVKKRCRNLRAGQVLEWDEDWFNGHGLYRLHGTIRYPKAA